MRPTDKATADSRSVQSFAITHPAQESLAALSLGSTSPTLLKQWCGFFYIPQEPDKWKCCETGSTVFRPYSRRLEILTVYRSHYKGITFCQFFNTGCWSCRGLHPQPSVRQIGDFSTETTRRQLKTVVLSSLCLLVSRRQIWTTKNSAAFLPSLTWHSSPNVLKRL